MAKKYLKYSRHASAVIKDFISIVHLFKYFNFNTSIAVIGLWYVILSLLFQGKSSPMWISNNEMFYKIMIRLHAIAWFMESKTKEVFKTKKKIRVVTIHIFH